MRTLVVITALVHYEKLILLLKRSENSMVMPSLWEFPSGYMKEFESAENAALREIKEETGLVADIEKTAKPLCLVESERRWIVIPFLVSVGSKAIFISSEHSEYTWIKPSDLIKFSTVIGTKRVLDCLSYG